jgi:hypothetical protein
MSLNFDFPPGVYAIALGEPVGDIAPASESVCVDAIEDEADAALAAAFTEDHASTTPAPDDVNCFAGHLSRLLAGWNHFRGGGYQFEGGMERLAPGAIKALINLMDTVAFRYGRAVFVETNNPIVLNAVAELNWGSTSKGLKNILLMRDGVLVSAEALHSGYTPRYSIGEMYEKEML